MRIALGILSLLIGLFALMAASTGMSGVGVVIALSCIIGGAFAFARPDISMTTYFLMWVIGVATAFIQGEEIIPSIVVVSFMSLIGLLFALGANAERKRKLKVKGV